MTPIFISSNGANNLGANTNHDQCTQIDFGNKLRVILEIVDGKIVVIDAMDGYGDTIQGKDITVTTLGKSPQADKEVQPCQK